MLDPELERDVKEFITGVENTVIGMISSGTLVNGPVYARYNRMLAYLHLRAGNDLEAIYHLTESHAVTLRNTALKLHEINKDAKPKQIETSTLDHSSLNKDCLAFSVANFKKGPSNLLNRLKNLPSEWTLVQLTLEYDETETYFSSCDTKMLPLHLTRLPCGEMLSKSRIPVTVTVDHSTNPGEGTTSILEQVQQCIEDNNASAGSVREKRSRRAQADKHFKLITGEIITSWLRQWSCLLVGRLTDAKLENLIVSTVDKLLETPKKQTVGNSSSIVKLNRIRSILYQVLDCCAHLSENEITLAVEYCFKDRKSANSIVSAMLDFKTEHSIKLMLAARHPVLLILDDRLERVPWEMTSILLKHPVSRVPSLHFCCALFEKHKENIQNGVVIIKEAQSGFYVVNPDKDLKSSEKCLLEFFKKRRPQWLGVVGERPSTDQALHSLYKNRIFLYSGHGNGSHFLKTDDIERTGLTVVPLLFGCSSVSKLRIGEGGLPELWGISDHFILAGSPCMFGMLWSVFNTETDILTLAFLNICLPGESIDVNDIIGSEVVDKDIKQELQLLRALKPARTVVKRYMNAAAFIARGIPVAFKNDIE